MNNRRTVDSVEIPYWLAAPPRQTPKLAAPAEPPAPARNSFLDAVRTVALIRVIVWHTYGYAWMSYFIASMPAMFFVAGSLTAYSLGHGKTLDVLWRRFRRLLIPFWLLAAAAIAVMLAYDQASPSATSIFDTRDILWWVLPISDPRGSEWGITWWAPLWYVRCLVWLLLATPVLLWAWRRIGPTLLLLPLAGLAVAEATLSDGIATWQVKDAALYGFFWLLGFAYNDGLFSKLDTLARTFLCIAFAGAAASWAVTQPVAGGVVNASYPLHLFVGLAWLFGSLAFEGAIGRLAVRPVISSVVYWVNERALTIYLWQSLGLFAMYQILWADHHSGLTRDLLALPIVTSITFLAALLFGWLEDLAAGRKPRFWPSRTAATTRSRGQRHTSFLPRPAIAGAAMAGVVALMLAAGNISRDPEHRVVQPSARTVPPSGIGLHYRAQNATIMKNAPTREASQRTGNVAPEELQAEIEAWLQRWNLGGVSVSLRRSSGETWTGSSGWYDWGDPFDHRNTYGIASVTKTFTSALILRMAEQQLIDLDEPVSAFVPDFPGSEFFTTRQLLQHTSGLTSGDDLPPDSLAMAAADGLQFEPGTAYLYSRAGYYLLGLIIEDVLDMPYTQALREQFIDPLGLTATFMDDEIVGLPYSTHPYQVDLAADETPLWSAAAFERPSARFDYYGRLWSAGGLISTTEDLARWGVALWGSEDVLSAASLKDMTTFKGADFDYTGLGTYPFCPCWWDKDVFKAERWGFIGLTGTLEYDPVDKLALAVHMSGTILDDNMFAALDDLSVRLRGVVRGRPMPKVTEVQLR